MGSDARIPDSGTRNNGDGHRKMARRLRVCAVVSLFAGAVLLASFALWCVIAGPAPPAALPPAGRTIEATLPFRFAIVGDSRGTGSTFEEVLKRINTINVSLILHGGDLVMRDSQRHFDWVLHELDEEQLDVPFCAVAGSHDLADESTGTEARYASYTRAFGPRHYWFRCANALFVALDTATGRLSQDELKWLDDTLTLHRPGCAACFVFTHYPPRDPRPGSSHALNEGAEALVGLLKKHGVSALLASHIHGYLEDNVEGVSVFITGGGGAKLAEGFREYHCLICTVEADGSFKCWKNVIDRGSDEDFLEHQFYVSFSPTAAVLVGTALLALGVALAVWSRKRARLEAGRRGPP